MDCEYSWQLLDNMGNSKVEGKGLVKISASWCWDLIDMSFMSPSLILSRTKWIYFDVLSMLMKYRIGCNVNCCLVVTKGKSWRWQVNAEVLWKLTYRNQFAMVAKALSSASAEEQAIVDFFWAFQETEESLKKTKTRNRFPWVSAWSPISIKNCSQLHKMTKQKKKNPWLGLALR